MCIYVCIQILRAPACITAHNPNLCRSQITLFNETLALECKHPKFAGIMSEQQTTSAKEPIGKTWSGHWEPGSPEGCTCTAPKYCRAGPSARPSPAGIISVGWLADRWVTRGINSESCVFPLVCRQPLHDHCKAPSGCLLCAVLSQALEGRSDWETRGAQQSSPEGHWWPWACACLLAECKQAERGNLNVSL